MRSRPNCKKRRVKEVEDRVEQIMAGKENNSAGTRKPGEKRNMSGTEHTRGPGKTSSMSLLMLCLLNLVMVLLQSLPDLGEMTGRQAIMVNGMSTRIQAMFSRKVEAMHKDTKIGKKSSTGRDPVIGAETMGVPEEQVISLFFLQTQGLARDGGRRAGDFRGAPRGGVHTVQAMYETS